MNRRTLVLWAVLISALLMFTGCGKKAEPVQETKSVMDQPGYTEESVESEVTEKVVEEVVTEEVAETKVPADIDEGPAIYTVQLISLPDQSRVKLQQEIMEKRGIETEIKIFETQGTNYYRLRLSGRYTRARAELLGAEMKDLFWSITDYWVVEG
jgi:hypothetical protein